MDEEVSIILIMALWALLAFVLYQRFWVIRRLRNKLDKVADAAIASVQSAGTRQAITPAPFETDELRRIQQRLQVLERITVEKEHILAREIEDLRAAG